MRSDLAKSYGQDRLPRYTSYPTAPHFSAVDRRSRLSELAQIDPCSAAGLHLSSRTVLQVHVLVLRMPHLRDEARRSDRDLRVGPANRSASGRRDHRTEAADLPRPLRRRHADDHDARNLRRPCRRSALFVLRAARCRDRGRDRPAHADRTDGGGAGLLRRQPREPGRPELRSRSRNAPSTACRASSRRPSPSSGCAGPASSRLNFDLLYGLPLQTVESCLDTVAKCLELRPDRFSVFGYAHIPSFKKHQRKIAEDDVA